MNDDAPPGRRPLLPVLLPLAALLVALAPPAAAQPAGAVGRFAAPAFERLWAAGDAAVAGGEAGRPWTWGPGPVAAAREPYAEGAGGDRLVQYFDKARMELTAPTADPASPWYVTNGLLVREMVAGRLQIGDDQFLARPPATAPVAGDPDSPDAPGYAAFADLATIAGERRAADRTGQLLDQAVNGGGRVRAIKPRREEPAYRFARYEAATGHNVLAAFHEFMSGRPDLDPTFVFGHPITEPYWVAVNLNGEARDVVVQLFERRVLTLAPDNPPASRVEMGNVGQHYYWWRYRGSPPDALLTADPATPGLPVRVRGFNWPSGGAMRLGIAAPDAAGGAPLAAAMTDGVGSVEAAIVWSSAVADAYAEHGPALVVWAVGPNEAVEVRTPLQLGSTRVEHLAGEVVGVARAERLISLRLASGVVKRLALGDATAIRRPDGAVGGPGDVVVGARLEVDGRPGAGGLLLLDRLVIRAYPTG